MVVRLMKMKNEVASSREEDWLMRRFCSVCASLWDGVTRGMCLLSQRFLLLKHFQFWFHLGPRFSVLILSLFLFLLVLFVLCLRPM